MRPRTSHQYLIGSVYKTGQNNNRYECKQCDELLPRLLVIIIQLMYGCIGKNKITDKNDRTYKHQSDGFDVNRYVSIDSYTVDMGCASLIDSYLYLYRMYITKRIDIAESGSSYSVTNGIFRGFIFVFVSLVCQKHRYISKIVILDRHIDIHIPHRSVYGNGITVVVKLICGHYILRNYHGSVNTALP